MDNFDAALISEGPSLFLLHRSSSSQGPLAFSIEIEVLNEKASEM